MFLYPRLKVRSSLFIVLVSDPESLWNQSISCDFISMHLVVYAYMLGGQEPNNRTKLHSLLEEETGGRSLAPANPHSLVPFTLSKEYTILELFISIL